MPRQRRQGGKGKTAVMLGSGTMPKSSLVARTSISTRKMATDTSPALLALSEAQFQRIVRAELDRRGFVVWVFPIMKRTMAGVPDLTFWHPARPGHLYAWELKREQGRIRPEQAVAIAHLATVPGIDARIVRPSQWPALRDELLGV